MSKTLEMILAGTAGRSRVADRSNLEAIRDEYDARIAELTAEVDRAKGLVEAAYREGFSSGAQDAMEDERGRGGYGMEQLWQISDARNALKEG